MISLPVLLISVVLIVFIILFSFMAVKYGGSVWVEHRPHYTRRSLVEVDRMTGIEFEHYLGALLKSRGFKIMVTQASGDYGADLVLEKGGLKTVVQVKRYDKNVGLRAVQEVYAAVAYYGASSGWVITNSRYTAQAKNLASRTQVRLVDRDELAVWIEETRTQTG